MESVRFSFDIPSSCAQCIERAPQILIWKDTGLGQTNWHQLIVLPCGTVFLITSSMASVACWVKICFKCVITFVLISTLHFRFIQQNQIQRTNWWDQLQNEREKVEQVLQFKAYPRNCNFFFMNHGSSSQLMKCHTGLYFDQTNNVCTYPQNVDCIEEEEIKTMIHSQNLIWSLIWN